MLCEGFTADLLHIKNKNRKPPAAGYFGVLLTQGTGSSIARIFERRSALQLLLCAELLERSVRHIHFTAHFQKLWCILQFFGNAANGTDIGCNVFAYYAIAAGGGTNQLTILIFQAAGKTIDLDLDHILRLCACFAHTAVKVAQFIIRKSIQKALHFDRVGHLGQFAAGGTAHLLRGRRCRYQLWKLCFQRFQLPGQGIILKIFQFRRILIIACSNSKKSTLPLSDFSCAAFLTCWLDDAAAQASFLLVYHIFPPSAKEYGLYRSFTHHN